MSDYFLYVGNAYPHKNLGRLIGSMILLNETFGEKIVLKIASSRNVFTKKLEDEIKKVGASEFIELLGFIPDAKLEALYKNSLAFVFPSLSEGFGLPGLEAMKAGTLLLASNIPVFKEIYKNHAIYFNPLDFSSIEHSMRTVLGMSKSEREEKIKSAQKFAKTYSWRKMAEQTLTIYKSFE